MELIAALALFTRLPLGRHPKLRRKHFRNAVVCWPIVGWITGGCMAATLWLTAAVLPQHVAAACAVAVRLLLTGALHEDGLADFCDGFGGGTSPQSTLRIMKDPHIGTYGVISLTVYLLLFVLLMGSLPLATACAVAIAADAWAKATAAQLVVCLPYARTMQESKTGSVYRRPSVCAKALIIITGVLPAILLLPFPWWLAGLCPIAVFVFFCRWIKRRIGGYTGDCCGAVFLFLEISFWLGAAIMVHYW